MNYLPHYDTKEIKKRSEMTKIVFILMMQSISWFGFPTMKIIDERYRFSTKAD